MTSRTEYTGTLRLVRLALRRDRIQLPIWLLALSVLVSGSVSSIKNTYPTDEDLADLANTIADSPALLMMRGSAPAPTVGGLLAAQLFATAAVAVGLMSTLAVIRHTRQNEETGRAELLASGVVGRRASLTAALVVVSGANLLFALLAVLLLIGAGLPAAGSFAFGIGLGLCGVVFAGFAAITAQVYESARAANGSAAAMIGVAFVLRGIGDTTGELQSDGTSVTSTWPAWLSPIGWGQQAHPYGQERWWLLALPLVLIAVTVGTAYVLAGHRDLGLGMRAARPGPAQASPRLLSPLGLAWRLQRGTLLSWAIAMTFGGCLVGSMGETIEENLADNEQVTELLEKVGGTGSLAEIFFGAELALMSAIVAVYTMMALLQMRSEETGALEAVLATSVSRARWMASHVTCAVLGTALLLLLSGLGMGISYGLTVGDVGGQASSLTGAALTHLPAAMAFAGFVIVMFGLFPLRAISFSAAGLGIALILGQFGELFGIPQAVRGISPFSHIPAVPAEDFAVVPFTVLTVVAVALAAAGLATFRRRDLAP